MPAASSPSPKGRSAGGRRLPPTLLAVCAAATAAGILARGAEEAGRSRLPQDRPAGRLELVATFHDQMPTGVTVSHEGRIFVNFPRWGDKVEYTVAELKDGKPVPYPDAEFNRFHPDNPAAGLISVQSVVVDPQDRLWILDTGSLNFGPPLPGGPRLIGVDLRSNRVFKTITFPPDVALKTTYLNDVRFDLRRGPGGLAFITDSADKGPNGIIVVDLGSGQSWRRLNNHPSMRAVPGFLPVVEGRPLMNRPPKGKPSHLAMGSDGIAIGSDGSRLFYCPLASRHLYSVSVDALAKRELTDEQVAKTVQDHGDKGGGADGLETDSKGRIYMTNYEHNAILRRLPDGTIETVIHDPRLLWPDTLSVAPGGYLYVTANQLHRQGRFHDDKDLRQRPFELFRVRIDAGPVLLK
jgi:sugar lactone lactonase YvrE